MRILFNHVGYAAAEPKRILLEAPAETAWRAVELVTLPAHDTVRALTPRFVGGVAGWSVGPWWEIDLTDGTARDRNALRWSTGTAARQSEDIEIRAHGLGLELVSDLLF